MATTFNMSLLDKSIDEIEDLAGFEVPNSGMYLLKFNAALKVVNDKDCVEANFEILETMELNDSNAVVSKAGTKFSTLFFIDDEAGIGLGRLKEFMMPLSVHFNQPNLLALIQQDCKDVVIGAKVKKTADKKDADKFYANVSNVTVS